MRCRLWQDIVTGHDIVAAGIRKTGPLEGLLFGFQESLHGVHLVIFIIIIVIVAVKVVPGLSGLGQVFNEDGAAFAHGWLEVVVYNGKSEVVDVCCVLARAAKPPEDSLFRVKKRRN